MIPKIIHHIWIQGGDNMKEEDKIKVDAIRNLNPDYKHMIWDDESIKQLLLKYPNLYETYMNVDRLKSYKIMSENASKSDIARWVILYEYGGCYMDVDVSCTHSINELLKKMPQKEGPLIAVPVYNLYLYKDPSSAFILSTPGHPAFYLAFSNVIKAQSKEQLGGALSDAILHHKKYYPSEVYFIKDTEVSCYHCGKPGICMIPIEVGSTVNGPRMFLSWWCKYKAVVSIGIILILLLVIYFMFKYRSCCNACPVR